MWTLGGGRGRDASSGARFQFQISALIQLVSFEDTLIMGSRRADGVVNNSRIHRAKGTLSEPLSSVGGRLMRRRGGAVCDSDGINYKCEHLRSNRDWKHKSMFSAPQSRSGQRTQPERLIPNNTSHSDPLLSTSLIRFGGFPFRFAAFVPQIKLVLFRMKEKILATSNIPGRCHIPGSAGS